MRNDQIWCIVIILCVEIVQVFGLEDGEDDKDVDLLDSWGLERGKKKKKHRYLLAVLLGMILVKAIIIPLALKAMAIISGKAILLSALSLILASIVGFKKMAQEGWMDRIGHNHLDRRDKDLRGDINYYPYPPELTEQGYTQGYSAQWSRDFKNN